MQLCQSAQLVQAQPSWGCMSGPRLLHQRLLDRARCRRALQLAVPAGPMQLLALYASNIARSH